MNEFIYWFRGEKLQLANNFWAYEFECHCGNCELQAISTKLVHQLQATRDDLTRLHSKQMAIDVNSGFRCHYHNRSSAVGGAPHSYHRIALAADIEVNGLSTEDVYIAAKGRFTGYGLSAEFLHVDMRAGGPVLFTY